MTSTTQPASVLARLRALNPRHGISRTTACSIAERQAALLLQLGHITTGPVPLRVFGELPRIELALADLPTSGLSYWTGQAWRLEARRGEAAVRQRFTLAHEFKHVIDHPVRDLLYADHLSRERAADQFAACLLMPKRLVVAAWCSGEQDIAQLAELFVVSPEAMRRRLDGLGLVERESPRPLYCRRGATQALPNTSTFAIARSRSIGVSP